MKFTIKNTRLHNLTLKELETFFKLTLSIGTMKDIVSHAWEYRRYDNNFLLSYAVYRNKKIGWITTHNTRDGRFINVFVHPEYRRRGVGTALVREIKKRSRSKLPVRSCPWDCRSGAFFQNFPKIKVAPGFYW